MGVAFLRAVHQVIDSKPPILDDPVVLRLFDQATLAKVLEHPDRFQSPQARALRAHVVLRSRFAEECLANAAFTGTRQLVMLGAGFDTFAFRQPEWAHSLQIFEIDQHATQDAKRERLTAAGIPTAANLRFVAIDFETESLRDCMIRGGINPGERTFFSWLGVTMYLTEEAIDATFRVVADFPRGSEIVFTFAQPKSKLTSLFSRTPSLAERAAAVGEPWLTYMTPREQRQKLSGFGFSEISFLSPEEADLRYFRGRADGLPAPRRASICAAIV
jgi:methyltransferase (TIGR00027 family)